MQKLLILWALLYAAPIMADETQSKDKEILVEVESKDANQSTDDEQPLIDTSRGISLALGNEVRFGFNYSVFYNQHQTSLGLDAQMTGVRTHLSSIDRVHDRQFQLNWGYRYLFETLTFGFKLNLARSQYAVDYKYHPNYTPDQADGKKRISFDSVDAFFSPEIGIISHDYNVSVFAFQKHSIKNISRKQSDLSTLSNLGRKAVQANWDRFLGHKSLLIGIEVSWFLDDNSDGDFDEESETGVTQGQE